MRGKKATLRKCGRSRPHATDRCPPLRKGAYHIEMLQRLPL